MIKNYFKISFRNIIKQKINSFINIAGLSIGFTACILIALWVFDELSRDNYHNNYSNIYKITTINNNQEGINKTTTTPFALANLCKENFPEASIFGRTLHFSTLLSYKDKLFTDNEIAICDNSIFDIFTIPIEQKASNIMLPDKYSIIISKNMSEKFFGNENPLGKIITYSGKYELKVTGLLGDIPGNSRWNVDCIVSLKLFGDAVINSWDFEFAHTYLCINDNENPQQIESSINKLYQNQFKNSNKSFSLISISDINLYGINSDGVFKYVVIFSLIAFGILIIACINFINLSISRLNSRAPELAIRKIIGASGKNLFFLLFIESIILNIVSFIIAIVFTIHILPVFNQITAKNLDVSVWQNYELIAIISGIMIIASTTTGLYPFFFQSRLKTGGTSKISFLPFNTNSTLRKVLVTAQFTISIILICGTLFINKQLQYVNDKELGYNKENVVYFSAIGGFKSRFDEIKNELLSNPNIINISRSSSLPNYTEKATTQIEWMGKLPTNNVTMHPFYVDFDFLETFEFQIIAGRTFSKKITTDSSSYVLNEAAVKVMGKMPDKIIGEDVTFNGKKGKIIGVVSDFHHSTLYNKIEPIVICYQSGFIVSTRINSKDKKNTLEFIKSKWKEHVSNYPFEYEFFSDVLSDSYKSEQMVKTLIEYFMFLALFISSLGLYGLVLNMIQLRVKEIGIRKTLGASISSILLLFSGEYVKLILIANIIAIPIAWYTINNRLQNFAYRTELHWWVFLLSGGIALLIAVLTVSSQAIKAALANPVESLRYE